jgi:hypothetical protein
MFFMTLAIVAMMDEAIGTTGRSIQMGQGRVVWSRMMLEVWFG